MRPRRDKAMEVLGDVVAERVLDSCCPIEGTIVYEPENDRCILV
jgi:hypothetical protein